MEKYNASLAQKKCIVCDKEYDSGEILFDKTFQKGFDNMTTVVGLGLCPEHDKSDEGFTLLIEIDESKSTLSGQDKVKIEDAYKTGKICHMKSEIFEILFERKPEIFQYVDVGVIDEINKIVDNTLTSIDKKLKNED